MQAKQALRRLAGGAVHPFGMGDPLPRHHPVHRAGLDPEVGSKAVAVVEAALGLPLDTLASLPDEELMAAIARKRGAIGSGGTINWQKAAELLIADFRSGVLGRITLETPEQFARWLKAGLKADADRAARKNKLREDGHIRPERKPRVDQRGAPGKKR